MHFDDFLKRIKANFVDVEIDCDRHGKQAVSTHVNQKEAPICPECDREAKEHREALDRFNQFISLSGIPIRYRNKTLDNYQTENESQHKALSVAKGYVNEFDTNRSRSLIITGDVGTGKTHLSIGLMKSLSTKGYRVFYTTINEMFSEVRSTFNDRYGRSENSVLDGYLSSDLLVIDEVGMSTLSSFENGFLYRVINGMYEREKAMIVVSNQRINDLAEILGDRVMDRLREDDGSLINMRHKSFRK